MSVKLGIAPIAWSNDDMPELGGDTSLEQCLSEASQAGFIGIESGGKFPKNSEELIPKLKEFSLNLCSGWYGANLRINSVNEEKKVRSSTREKGDIPIGNVKNVFKIDETLRVSGWAYDPDAPNGGLKIKHSGKTGEVKSLGQTNLNHEFSFDISDFDVDTPVCLWIENEGLARHNTFLGCHNATFG